MISEVDDNMSGSIDFGEFIKVVETQKKRAENPEGEIDMIDAYVACGGQPDKSGHVKRDTLIRIIKHDFGLTIDIEDLINKIDVSLIPRNTLCRITLSHFFIVIRLTLRVKSSSKNSA